MGPDRRRSWTDPPFIARAADRSRKRPLLDDGCGPLSQGPSLPVHCPPNHLRLLKPLARGGHPQDGGGPSPRIALAWPPIIIPRPPVAQRRKTTSADLRCFGPSKRTHHEPSL